MMLPLGTTHPPHNAPPGWPRRRSAGRLPPARRLPARLWCGRACRRGPDQSSCGRRFEPHLDLTVQPVDFALETERLVTCSILVRAAESYAGTAQTVLPVGKART